LRSGHLASVRRHPRYRDGQRAPATGITGTARRSPDSEPITRRRQPGRRPTRRSRYGADWPGPASLTFPNTGSVRQARIEPSPGASGTDGLPGPIHFSHQSLRSVRPPVGWAVRPRRRCLSFSCRAASAWAAVSNDSGRRRPAGSRPARQLVVTAPVSPETNTRGKQRAVDERFRYRQVVGETVDVPQLGQAVHVVTHRFEVLIPFTRSS
jgi:hypothetical protein